MIVGPSGCGKTSLLNAIAGFHDITSGAIYLDGKILCGPGDARAAPGSDRVGWFKNVALFLVKTVRDTVHCGLVMHGKRARRELSDGAPAPATGHSRRVEIEPPMKSFRGKGNI